MLLSELKDSEINPRFNEAAGTDPADAGSRSSCATRRGVPLQ